MLKRLFIVAVAVPLLGGYFTFATDLPEVVYQKYLAAIKTKDLGELKIPEHAAARQIKRRNP